MGRFSPDRLRSALGAVCDGAGLDPAGADLLKVTANAVFRLASAPVIVRLATSPAMLHRVDKVVTVARWLESSGTPAVRLLPGVPAPVRAGSHTATFWVDAGSGRAPPTSADLARLIGVLHRLPPPGGLPAWAPLDDVRRRLSDADGLRDADRAFLLARADEVGAALAGVRWALPRSVIHGDAHLGNLVRSATGQVVMCDFDATSIGPPEWDLTVVAVGTLRFGRPAEQYTALADGYGFDVTAWPGFEVLRSVRELKLTTSALPMLRSSVTIARQFAVRLASLRDGDPTARWSPYAQPRNDLDVIASGSGRGRRTRRRQ